VRFSIDLPARTCCQSANSQKIAGLIPFPLFVHPSLAFHQVDIDRWFTSRVNPPPAIVCASSVASAAFPEIPDGGAAIKLARVADLSAGDSSAACLNALTSQRTSKSALSTQKTEGARPNYLCSAYQFKYPIPNEDAALFGSEENRKSAG
jgi:hypothetical protein